MEKRSNTKINPKYHNGFITLHTDYLCPNLRLTVSTHVLSCAAAVFQTSPDDGLIRSICKFTY